MHKKKTTGSAIRTRDAMDENTERNHCAMRNTLTNTSSWTLLVSLTVRRKKKKCTQHRFRFLQLWISFLQVISTSPFLVRPSSLKSPNAKQKHRKALWFNFVNSHQYPISQKLAKNEGMRAKSRFFLVHCNFLRVYI